MSRNIKDADLIVTKALPAAGASNNSDSIDLGATSPDTTMESVELLVEVGAAADLVEDKTITVTIKDSADDSTFAAIAALSTIVVTGGSGNGAAAVSRRYRLPSTVKRYLRFYSDVLAGGGDNTGVSVTMTLLT